MSALPPRLAALVDHYAAIADRGERIQALIDLADGFRGVPPEVATRPYPESHKVPACESEAYLFARELPGDRLTLHFAVENPQGLSAKALAVLLEKTLSGLSARELVDLPGDFVFAVFGNELSMGKGLGLTGMVAMVQTTARRLLAARDSGDSNLAPVPPASGPPA